MDAKKLFGLIGTRRPANRPMQINSEMLPFAGLSYAMSGEDLLLCKLLKTFLREGKAGVYVDVGCGEPGQSSNSFLFYGMGWRGLCIDANRDVQPLWASFRPEDLFVNAAVGEQAGEVYLYHHKSTNTGMCRVSATGDELEGFVRGGPPLPMLRLDDLFARHIGDRPIQFMSMDIEGSELGALRSNNWNRWRPGIIVLECLDFDFRQPLAAPTVAYLDEQGYRLEGKIGANLFFLPANAA